MMSKLSNLMPPNSAEVRKLSDALAGKLKTLFHLNAIDGRSGIEFALDSGTGTVRVAGNRSDAEAIAAVIENHPDVARQINDMAVLSRQIVLSEKETELRKAHQVAQSAARLRSLFADASAHLDDASEAQEFSLIPPAHAGHAADNGRAIASYTGVAGTFDTDTNISMVFNGADLQVHVNGRPLLFTSA